ncbi:MAG: tRNA (guanosine(37)-N1)-methyltransferase TrmD [Cellvibrionaceae bacterium]|nr:tRNA (guanosine(37)-N1)-methyltransferase TrmD [Cellvibrionaceae bacterium]
MKVAVISLFPEMFAAVMDHGITGRAVSQGLLEITLCNPRDFTDDPHQTVDDRPYGGGPGMVMKIAPLQAAIAAMKHWAGSSSKVVYLSPQGQLLKQSQLRAVVDSGDRQALILIAGRYEGVDERLLHAEVDEQWSIGDYVLSGGELPAMVVVDGLIRLLPNALGHKASAEQDSFTHGLLDCPHYTRPQVYAGAPVPAVLLSGNHQRIERWRLQQSLGRTWLRRPELLEALDLSAEQTELLAQFKAELADHRQDDVGLNTVEHRP